MKVTLIAEAWSVSKRAEARHLHVRAEDAEYLGRNVRETPQPVGRLLTWL